VAGSSQRVFELNWPGRQHLRKSNIPLLKFHLGSPSQAANGKFFDVRVDFGAGSFFGNIDDVLNYKNKYVPSAPALFSDKLTDNFLIKDEVASGRTQSNEDLVKYRKWQFEGEVLEYAIHGWYRWVDWKPDTWNNIFRVTYQPLRFQNNANYIGDRDLTVWNGPGYVHFTTSTYQQNYGDNWNVVQNIDYRNDLAEGKWIYIYFGYSRLRQSAFGYLKFADREATVKFDGIRHQIAKEFHVFIGKDNWHSGTNGYLKDWHFHTGKDSYRESGLETFYNKRTAFKLRTEFNTPQHLASTTYVQAELEHTKNYLVEVPSTDLQNVVEYSYSFYHKFTWLAGTTDLGRLRSWWHCLAGFTENPSYAGTSWGDRNLAIFFIYWGASVGFHATTYDYNCNRDCGNYWKNFEGNNMFDIQNSWTKVYMGYSHEKRSAFAYFNFERTGKTFYMEWPGILHNNPLQRLTFIAGGLPNQYHPAPGYYADIRVHWKSGAYISNVKDVEAYFNTATVYPKNFGKLEKTLYPLIDDKPFALGRNDGTRRFTEVE